MFDQFHNKMQSELFHYDLALFSIPSACNSLLTHGIW